MSEYYGTVYPSPLGNLEIIGTANAIIAVQFSAKKISALKPNKITADCVQQLSEYFLGKRKKFSLSLELQGTTFQKKIWRKLLKIHHGKTVAYSDLGPANRAIGTACGKNKIAVIIPCHRVINKNGRFGGYAGGLWRKTWLLKWEATQKK